MLPGTVSPALHCRRSMRTFIHSLFFSSNVFSLSETLKKSRFYLLCTLLYSFDVYQDCCYFPGHCRALSCLLPPTTSTIDAYLLTFPLRHTALLIIFMQLNFLLLSDARELQVGLLEALQAPNDLEIPRRIPLSQPPVGPNRMGEKRKRLGGMSSSLRLMQVGPIDVGAAWWLPPPFEDRGPYYNHVGNILSSIFVFVFPRHVNYSCTAKV